MPARELSRQGKWRSWKLRFEPSSVKLLAEMTSLQTSQR